MGQLPSGDSAAQGSKRDAIQTPVQWRGRRGSSPLVTVPAALGVEAGCLVALCELLWRKRPADTTACSQAAAPVTSCG